VWRKQKLMGEFGFGKKTLVPTALNPTKQAQKG
jgi:hypothetical protein